MDYSIFEGLNGSDLKKIKSYFQWLSFAKKDVIYTKKEEVSWFFDDSEKKTWIYFIKSGIVKISVKHVNKNYTIAFLKWWDFFWELSSILWFEPSADVTAVTDVEVDFLDSKVFLDLMLKMPNFSMNISKYLANRIQALSWNIFDHVFRSLESRVASNILNLVNEFWEVTWESDNEVMIWIKVTHQDLSDFIWTNRETVTKILNQFRKRKILDFVDRKILITDLKAIKEIANT